MSTLNEESIVSRTGEQVATEVEDKVALLQLSTGKYYALNAVGALIWSQLESPRTIRALAESVVAEYDIDLQTAVKDARILVQALHDAGFLTIEGGTT